MSVFACEVCIIGPVLQAVVGAVAFGGVAAGAVIDRVRAGRRRASAARLAVVLRRHGWARREVSAVLRARRKIILP